MDINESFILRFTLLFAWIEYLWELYLSLRQLRVYKINNTIPDDLKTAINEDTFKKARLYGIDKSKYRIFRNLFNIVQLTVIIQSNWIFVLWNASENIGHHYGISSDQEVMVSSIFITLGSLINFALLFPFSLYESFVLEENHGFNKQTFVFFIKDQLKMLFLSLVILVPVLSATVYIVMIGGNMFVIWLWLFTTFVTMTIVMLYPNVIAPLFDKFVPLEDGNLKSGIENLASNLKFPLGKIYIVEGSKRSAHSNAYFAGLFGAKRIVLFDTLIEKYHEEKKETTGCTDNEILGVLAHELGHWKLSHIYKSMFITQVNLLMLFAAFGFLFKYSLLYKAFGFPDGQEPVIIGMVVICQMILQPYNSLLSYLLTAMSRKFEYEADTFAVTLKYDKELKSALIKLGKDNLDFPYCDTLYSSWHHSHPTLLQRIENIKVLMQNKKTN